MSDRQGVRVQRTSAPRKLDPATEAAKLLTRFKVASLPVPVEALAQDLGARLAVERLDTDLSGFVARQPGSVIIGVNSAHPPTRQRFTIAHEIGHLRLHAGRRLIVDKLMRVNMRHAASHPIEGIEREANRFAAHLLMPEQHVRRELEKLTPKRTPIRVDRVIGQLADTFAVSPQAMAYRLRELQLMSELGLY